MYKTHGVNVSEGLMHDPSLIKIVFDWEIRLSKIPKPKKSGFSHQLFLWAGLGHVTIGPKHLS